MAYEFKNISVLIVENAQPMFELTKSVLTTFGVNRVYHALEYKDGFRNFCRYKPDLIITDWLEGSLNALDLTKSVRSDPSSPNPFVPIILMTGYSSTKRVLMARDSGITAFMAKPYNAKTLFSKIEHLVEHPRQFVKSEYFIGPDRRHMRETEYCYSGPDRRWGAVPPGHP